MTRSPCRDLRGLRLEHQFLDAPGLDLSDEDLIGVPAVHHVHDLKPAEFLARVSEAPEDRAVQLHLVDLARVLPRARPVAVRVGVGGEQVLMRARRDADAPRRADVVVNRAEDKVVVEHLHPVVRAIGDVHVALRVDREAVRQVELARLRSGPLAADLLQEPSVLVVLHDAMVDVAVGDEDVALRVPADVGRTAQRVFLRRRRRTRGRARQHSQRGLGPAAKHHHDAAFGIELDHHVRPSSTAQMLSCGSTRTECANSKP